MPKVSVVIPTYNRPDFLRLAIRSVLDQTFQDFEIIVVDDASMDNISQVVGGFKDKRIKYIRHEVNKGGSAARNTGIMKSSCEYIAFLDDDDEWLPPKLKMQVDLLDNSPPVVGGIYTGSVKIDRNSQRVFEQLTPTKRGDLASELLVSNCLSSAGSSILLKKECFEQMGLFDENLPSFQDYDMWIRISKQFHFEYIKDPLVKYYFHEDKIWTNPEALTKGIAIMLKKYGRCPTVRKNFSRYYLGLGVDYCYKENTGKGRELFLKAIRLNPFEIRHYFNLIISLLGIHIFRKLKQIKEIVKGIVISQ